MLRAIVACGISLSNAACASRSAQFKPPPPRANAVRDVSWKSSVILPIYKGKGGPMECGSYRGIKLLEHAVKVVERIFEHRIRQQIEADDMQFGFINSKTTDAIFTVRQMQENFRVKGKTLYFGFVDLEKAL